jgi:hypothetical protein
MIMRYAFIYSSAFLLFSCACAEEGVGIYGGDLPLRELDETPGCYVAPPPFTSDDEVEQQNATAAQELIEYQLSSAMTNATFLMEPVRRDPNATEWKYEDQEAIAEGVIIARGRDWALLRMVALTEVDGSIKSLESEISLLPDRAVFQLGAAELELTDRFVRYDTSARGCDPATGTSFQKVALLYSDGTLRDDLRCWPEMPMPACSGEDLEVCRQEFRASQRLQCSQVISKVLLW